MGIIAAPSALFTELRATTFLQGTYLIDMPPRQDGRPRSGVRTLWTKFAARFHSDFAFAEYPRVATAANFPAWDWLPLHFMRAMVYGASVERVVMSGGLVDFVPIDPENVRIVPGVDGAPPLLVVRTRRQAGSWDGSRILASVEDTFEEIPWTAEAPFNLFRVSEDSLPLLGDEFYDHCCAYDIVRNAALDDVRYPEPAVTILNVSPEDLKRTTKSGETVLDSMMRRRIFPLSGNEEVKFAEMPTAFERFEKDLHLSRSALFNSACLPDLDSLMAGHTGGTITSVSGGALQLLFAPAVQAQERMRQAFLDGLRGRERWLAAVSDYNSGAWTWKAKAPTNPTELLQYAPGLKDLLDPATIKRMLEDSGLVR